MSDTSDSLHTLWPRFKRQDGNAKSLDVLFQHLSYQITPLLDRFTHFPWLRLIRTEAVFYIDLFHAERLSVITTRTIMRPATEWEVSFN
jgi:hypothetical protein